MLKLKNTKALIWDWNGTLLNNLEISILSMNQMLGKRNIPLLNIEKYLSVFTFPVQDYYRKAGVDFDEHDWETVAMEFIGNYRKNVVEAGLHPDVKEILEFFRQKNIKQYILSAMQQDFLEETVIKTGIGEMFDKIVGLNNHYAATKEDVAKHLIREIGISTDEICMVGDTIHDFEVAGSVGIGCILIAHGHQSHKRLKETGTMVIRDFGELRRLFL
jgi:phosphoglycolate phosphatase